MNTWKVILATLVIFGAGVVTGALLVKNSQHASQAAVQPPRNPELRPEADARGTNRPSGGPKMPGMRRDFLKNLDRELALTTEQRGRIEKILCEGQECTKQLWDKVEPQVRAEWNRVKEAIRAELTDEQKEKFDEFMKRPHKSEDRRRESQPSTADSPPPPAEPPSGATPPSP